MIFNLSALILGTLTLSAALTPLVILLIEELNGINPWPFSRVFDRVAMLSVVIMLLVLRKRMDLSLAKQALTGLTKRTVIFPIFFGLTLTSLSVFFTVLVLIYFTGDLRWTIDQLYNIPYRILTYVLVALLIGFVEELFFRIMLLQDLQKRAGFLVAALVTSFIYACVHFIVPVKTWQYQGFNPSEGFLYLLAVFSSFLQIQIILPLVGLFLVGMVLAVVIERSKSLFFCVGLHAGWILCSKLTRLLTDAIGDSPLANVVGHYQQHHLIALVPAWISVVVVGVLAVYSIPILKRATLPKSVV